MRLDPAAVDVGAVERPAVVEKVVLSPPYENGVVTGDGDIVEKDVRHRTAADRDPSRAERKALTGAPPAGADHQRRASLDDIVQLDLLELAGLAQLVRSRGRPRRRIGMRQERAAPLTVVGALVVGKAALWTVLGHRPSHDYSDSDPGTRPARMSVSCWTSAPVITSSPVSSFLRSRLTSSARRMSIFPWRIRRR